MLKHYELRGVKADGIFGQQTDSIVDCSRWEIVNVEFMDMVQVPGSKPEQQKDISSPVDEIGHPGLVSHGTVSELTEVTECACSRCSAEVSKDDYTYPYCVRCYDNPNGKCD